MLHEVVLSAILSVHINASSAGFVVFNFVCEKYFVFLRMGLLKHRYSLNLVLYMKQRICFLRMGLLKNRYNFPSFVYENEMYFVFHEWAY
jgi:hypothetical protein